MSVYDDYIYALETNSEIPMDGATEAAADALAFVQGLNDMFKAQGLDLPEVPDMYRLEGVIDGYVGELAAAVILLSNDQMGRTPEALERLHQEIGLKVPDSVSTGFLRLADRVRKTRAAQQKLVSS